MGVVATSGLGVSAEACDPETKLELRTIFFTKTLTHAVEMFDGEGWNVHGYRVAGCEPSPVPPLTAKEEQILSVSSHEIHTKTASPENLSLGRIWPFPI